MKLGAIAAAFGKGIFAGVAGTAAMTLSSTIEMKVREVRQSAVSRAYLHLHGGSV